MTYLLDTHTILWAFYDRARLGRRARQAIANDENIILVSAVSAWEIATKYRLGRLLDVEELEGDFVGWVTRAGYHLRSVEVEDGLIAGRLVGEHQDPWDRMLAAQALEDGVPIISIDAKLDGFGVRRIWE